MLTTVLMPTRNRAQILREVLESYEELQQPRTGWKLVIVDNGSTDETPEVIALFVNRLPLETLSEAKIGKNHALNAGLRSVEGDLVLFADDDAFPHDDWLVQLRNAADRHKAYSVFGGVIVPRWELPPPDWVRSVESGPVFCLTDPSWNEGPIFPGFVFGANMAIRASIFRLGARFDCSMGPRSLNYAMGSETEFVMRLHRHGHGAWHVPQAVVEHYIREAQMQKSWVLHRAVNFGRGYYRVYEADKFRESKSWMGIPSRLLLDTAKAGVRVCAAHVLFRPEGVFRWRWRFNFLRGQVIEANLLARRAAAGLQSVPPSVK